MNLEQVVFAVTVLVGSAGFSAIIVKWMERAKVASESKELETKAQVNEASATDLLTKASTEVVDMMGEQLKQAFARLAAVEQANIDKNKRILELEREVIDLKRHIVKLESGS